MIGCIRQPLLGAFLAATLITCDAGERPSNHTDQDVLAEEQVLYRGNGEEPQTLDPHAAEGVPAGHILRDLFEGLTSEAADGRIAPGAAQRWTVSPDGRTYTFYLDPNARWSNGDPLLASDFVFSMRRSSDPETASNSATMLLPILNAREVINGKMPPESLAVEALDERTLQIILHEPTAYFLSLLSHPSTFPVHRASLETFGNDFTRPGNLVSNGAFTLEAWNVRSSLVLVKNSQYRDAENTRLMRVIYLPIEDQASEVKQFRAGEVDWTMQVPNNQFDWLKEHQADALVVSPWLGSYFYGFNFTREPFADKPQLRRALTLAIDRNVITDKVTQYGEQASYSLVPPGINDYKSPVPEYAAWSQAERNTEARRLYEQTGYSRESPLKVEIRYNTSENHRKIALAIASMWKAVLGVEVSLVNEEWKVFLQNRTQKQVTQVFRDGWASDYNDPYSFLELFRSGSGQNSAGYSNSEYDALLVKVAREQNPDRRNRLLAEAERKLLEDNVIIPLYIDVSKRLVAPTVKGWQSNPMDHHLSRYMYKVKPGATNREGEIDSG